MIPDHTFGVTVITVSSSLGLTFHQVVLTLPTSMTLTALDDLALRRRYYASLRGLLHKRVSLTRASDPNGLAKTRWHNRKVTSCHIQS